MQCSAVREGLQDLHCSLFPPEPKACRRPVLPETGPPGSRCRMSAPRCSGNPSWMDLHTHQTRECLHELCLVLPEMTLLPQFAGKQPLPPETAIACTCCSHLAGDQQSLLLSCKPVLDASAQLVLREGVRASQKCTVPKAISGMLIRPT